MESQPNPKKRSRQKSLSNLDAAHHFTEQNQNQNHNENENIEDIDQPHRKKRKLNYNDNTNGIYSNDEQNENENENEIQQDILNDEFSPIFNLFTELFHSNILNASFIKQEIENKSIHIKHENTQIQCIKFTENFWNKQLLAITQTTTQ